MENMYLDDFLEMQQKGFKEKINSYGYYAVDGGQTKLIYEHKSNKSKIIFTLNYDKQDIKDNKQFKNYELFVDFINDKNEKYSGNSWYLGNQDRLVIDDIFNIISTDSYLKFTENLNNDESLRPFNNVRIHKGSDNWKIQGLDEYLRKGITQTQTNIGRICAEISNLLIYKNIKYGNSAIEPINIFYKGNNENSILIRLDDKLSRIKNNKDDIRVNDICDTIGYLVLLLIHKGVKPEQIEKLKD